MQIKYNYSFFFRNCHDESAYQYLQPSDQHYHNANVKISVHCFGNYMQMICDNDLKNN